MFLNSSWYSQLESCKWLQHMSGLMKAAVTVVTAIEEEARPVMVHCSDGWDRTPQIVSLAEILLDPYYRSLEVMFCRDLICYWETVFDVFEVMFAFVWIIFRVFKFWWKESGLTLDTSLLTGVVSHWDLRTLTRDVQYFCSGWTVCINWFASFRQRLSSI